MSKLVSKGMVRAAAFSFCLLIAFNLSSFSGGSARAADPAAYALCDIRVMYLFDEPESVDWGTLYYLNDSYGCRLDLVTFGVGSGFGVATREVEGRGLYLHTFFADANDSTAVDSVLASLLAERRPDIVILGESGGRAQCRQLALRLAELPQDTAAIFNIMKIYRRSGDDTYPYEPLTTVTLNAHELYARYRQRMLTEVTSLYSWLRPADLPSERLVRYELIKHALPSVRQDPDFLSGLRTIRLPAVIDSVLAEGAARQAFQKRVRNFLSFFGLTQNSVGRKRVENIMAGFRDLVTLLEQVESERDLSDVPGFPAYLRRLRDRAQRAVLHEVGMNWQGEIVLRDSPHGPKLKFRASLSVDGPQEIVLSQVRFHPYWDTVPEVLDSAQHTVEPHQSFVREYLIDVDRARLEAQMPESLLFTAELAYGRLPLAVSSTVPIWEAPDLDVRFQPDFHLIQPFARLNVDKVVASMNWKVVITKPRHYYGIVKLDLVTPRGVFAGAYRQELQLDKGHTQQTVRIPFSVSNLFELGIHEQIVSLSVDGRQVAVDTGRIRIASCRIDDKVKVGFLPDTTGLLEDILRMTDAAFQPLTDRSLLTADLDAYNVIIIGSGALRDYPSFRRIKGRVEDYLRYGGSLVVFGQPGDWPEGVLPVSLVPAQESVDGSELLNRISQARILIQPHAINESDLLAAFARRRHVSAAIVAPAECVYVTPTGATLLSVSRLGDGQIIYCGLPLIEMISELNLEAIHLFSNMLNY
ncbi:MAG TPA: hypothetical protein VMY05_07460 [Acidobacteriota bacterium]|nr:hypothetical protein [Acidobacteriota bacterium]